MLKRLFEWGNQEISFGNFIGLAFVTALVTMVVCFFLLIFAS